MEKNRENKGITLVALIVTIVILLILAGISISTLTNTGIFEKVQEAKRKTEEENKEEQRKIAQMEALINKEKTTYKGITIPEGFTPTKIEGEDSSNDGLVITDGYGNEYVWVEVPKTEEIYQKSGLSIEDFTDEEYNKIEEDLHEYTKDYRNETKCKDIYYPDSTDGWFKNEKEYNDLKHKMLKSVYQNGGFWVGRYEAGIEKWRTSYGETTVTPLSKANLYPYTFVTRTQAKVLAEQVESGSETSSLMFGVQWDLVLKYIENKNIDEDSKIRDKLNSNSEKIGNYLNSTMILNRGMYMSGNNWYNYDKNLENRIKNKEKEAMKACILTTGSSNNTRIQNIYDIAGNVWEWTLEKTDDNSNPCMHRGGGYIDKSMNYPASRRSIGHILYNLSYLGFRVTLF